MTKEQRSTLIAEIRGLSDRLYPDDEEQELFGREFDLLRERFYSKLGEYADRIPRLPVSMCPFCQAPLKRAIDPGGFDGFWWHLQVPAEFEEPAACEHFRVLQGAVKLGRPHPTEATAVVEPGPDVPFVIPALSSLPGMVAVISRVSLEHGDVAYPIAYFSDQEVAPERLHQPWCRDEFWWEDEEGKALWLHATDIWDFNLVPYFEKKSLLWVELDAAAPQLRTRTPEAPCPWESLPGDRLPQMFSEGERTLLELPTGEPAVPFGEPEDEPRTRTPEEMAQLREQALKAIEILGPAMTLTPEEKEELGDFLEE